MNYPKTVIVNPFDVLPVGAPEERYLVDMRLRNCRIVDALAAIGHTPMSFIRKNRLPIDEFYGLVNMTVSPWKTTGRRGVPLPRPVYRKSVKVLLRKTHKPIEALFNEQQLARPLIRNRAQVVLTEAQVRDSLPQLSSTAAGAMLLPVLPVNNDA